MIFSAHRRDSRRNRPSLCPECQSVTTHQDLSGHTQCSTPHHIMPSGGFSAWGTPASSTAEASSSSLPLFQNEAMQNFSWGKVKASMEAQMPTKVLGMGYQQRFQVFCGLLFLSAIFFALASFIGLPTLVRTELTAEPVAKQ